MNRLLLLMVSFTFCSFAARLSANLKFPSNTVVDIALDIPDETFETLMEQGKTPTARDVQLVVNITDEDREIIWSNPVDSDTLDYLMDWKVFTNGKNGLPTILSFRKWKRSLSPLVAKILSRKASERERERFDTSTTKIQFNISGLEAEILEKVLELRNQKDRRVALAEYIVIGQKNSDFVYFHPNKIDRNFDEYRIRQHNKSL